ncbi:MAG: glycine cleavage system protein GcvH [Spirochaetes bacterium]|nr:glycine cleavage system protein GcvH [Spirochaetota bacterium]
MSFIPENLKYTKEHEWVLFDEEMLTYTCGITDHAQEMLTDIVFVELPEKGLEVKKGERLAVVESVKAVSDVYAPLSGEVIEINHRLEDSPELLNSDPYGDGWICKLSVKNPSEADELLDATEYEAHIASGD